MLTVQTALGFTLTLVTIQLMPHFVEAVGWRYAFMPLAMGPVVGVWAMARLRPHPRFGPPGRRAALGAANITQSRVVANRRSRA